MEHFVKFVEFTLTEFRNDDILNNNHGEIGGYLHVYANCPTDESRNSKF